MIVFLPALPLPSRLPPRVSWQAQALKLLEGLSDLVGPLVHLGVRWQRELERVLLVDDGNDVAVRGGLQVDAGLRDEVEAAELLGESLRLVVAEAPLGERGSTSW